ncbi:hypothetical protein GCM10010360_51680 [Streptomyces nogalater]
MVTERMIGKVVTDGERVGILQDIIRDWEDPAEVPGQRKARPMAFVRPEGAVGSGRLPRLVWTGCLHPGGHVARTAQEVSTKSARCPQRRRNGPERSKTRTAPHPCDLAV